MDPAKREAALKPWRDKIRSLTAERNRLRAETRKLKKRGDVLDRKGIAMSPAEQIELAAITDRLWKIGDRGNEINVEMRRANLEMRKIKNKKR